MIDATTATLKAEASTTVINAVNHPVLSSLYDNLMAVGLVVVAAIGIATPIVKMIQKTNSETNTTISKNDTESFLYVHLKEQIENHKIELERSREENRRLWEMIRGLETRLSKLEHIERNLEELKTQLVVKESLVTTLQDKLQTSEKENFELRTDNSLKTEQLKHYTNY